jgi:hypothetical protein
MLLFRSTQSLQDQVCGRVVAHRQSSLTKIRKSHGLTASVFLRDGRVGHEVRLRKTHRSFETLLSGIDSMKQGSTGKRFKRAGHCKSLVGLIPPSLLGLQIISSEAHVSVELSSDSPHRFNQSIMAVSRCNLCQKAKKNSDRTL